MRGERPGARGDVPAVGIAGVDGDGPGVVAVAAFVGRPPGLSGVDAVRRTAAACLVRASRNPWVPGERVHVRLCAGPVILPARDAVARAHQSTEFDPDKEELAVVRARRDPAHVRGPRAGRKAPARPGRKLEQGVERLPALATVGTAEEATGLRARVDGAVGT